MDIDSPFWEWSPAFLLFYFAPVIIGAVRRFQRRSSSWPAWGLFLVVLFTGWTVIGWLFALRMAFRDKDVPWQALRTSGGAAPTTAATGWTPRSESSPCLSCSGHGYNTCMVCGGAGWKWEYAQTAESSSRQVHCGSCTNSGRITCLMCNGSGAAQF